MLRILIGIAAVGRCLNRFCTGKRVRQFSILHSALTDISLTLCLFMVTFVYTLNPYRCDTGCFFRCGVKRAVL